MRLLREQLEQSLTHYGEAHCVPIFRRWIAARAGQLGWTRETMIRLLKLSDLEALRTALEDGART